MAEPTYIKCPEPWCGALRDSRIPFCEACRSRAGQLNRRRYEERQAEQAAERERRRAEQAAEHERRQSEQAAEQIRLLQELREELKSKSAEASAPDSVENQAVGLAHKAIKSGKPINVSKIAKQVRRSRATLYRIKAFKDLVDFDRKNGKAVNPDLPSGTYNSRTGDLEAWLKEE
jgi:hypothetical protein